MTRNKTKSKYEYINPGTLLSPLPVVMVSCQSERSETNIITVAWTGIINTNPPMLSISLRPERYSYEIIKESSEFVINLVNKDLLHACDFCGVKSGREIDKFAHLNLTKTSIKEMTYAPCIAEAPISLACKVKQIHELGSHHMFIAEIVSVKVNSLLLDENNGLHLEEANLVTYSHGQYYELGSWLGFFGFSVANEKILAKRQKKFKNYNAQFKNCNAKFKNYNSNFKSSKNSSRSR